VRDSGRLGGPRARRVVCTGDLGGGKRVSDGLVSRRGNVRQHGRRIDESWLPVRMTWGRCSFLVHRRRPSIGSRGLLGVDFVGPVHTALPFEASASVRGASEAQLVSASGHRDGPGNLVALARPSLGESHHRTITDKMARPTDERRRRAASPASWASLDDGSPEARYGE
jgi:hypothetical protein